MDNVNKTKRSENMRRIKSKNTKCELLFRKEIYRIGYRYRIHYKHLPGKPDIYLSKYKIAIFIHGCFWHLHEGCSRGNLPKTNTDYWLPKLAKNKENDEKNIKKLNELGIRVFIVWECEMSQIDSVIQRFKDFIQSQELLN